MSSFGPARPGQQETPLQLAVRVYADTGDVEKVKAALDDMGMKASSVAKLLKSVNLDVASSIYQAEVAARAAITSIDGLFNAVNVSENVTVGTMNGILARMQAERRLISDAQAAFGRYSPVAMNFSQLPNLEAQTVTPNLRAHLEADTLFGTGFSEKMQQALDMERAHVGVLNDLISYLGVASTEVAEYADAWGISTAALSRYRAEQASLAMPFTEPIGPVRPPGELQRTAVDTTLYKGALSDIQAYNSEQRALQQGLQLLVDYLGVSSEAVRKYADSWGVTVPALERYEAEQAKVVEQQKVMQSGWASPIGPTRPLSMVGPSVRSQAYGTLDELGGAGFSERLLTANATTAANKAVMQELLQQYDRGAPIVRDFARQVNISESELKRMTATVQNHQNPILQMGRGYLAGALQLSLLTTAWIAGGRILEEFTSGAVKNYRELEDEARNLSTVQPKLNIGQLEEQLNQLRREIPATLKEIATSYYEVASLGGGQGGATPAFTTAATEKLSIGAKLARADIKTWTDDVITSMNTWNMWSGNVTKDLETVDAVQSKFFKAAQDSLATPAQLAQAWGPVAISVQQAGGSMDDALALMVAASKGTGDFAQNMTVLTRAQQEYNQTDTKGRLEQFGIAVTDVSGKAYPFLDVLNQLKARFDDMNLNQSQRAEMIGQLFPQVRSERGVQLLLDQLDAISREYPRLNAGAEEYHTNVDKYLDSNIAHAQRLQNTYEGYTTFLGRLIDPANFLRGAETVGILLHAQFDPLLRQFPFLQGIPGVEAPLPAPKTEEQKAIESGTGRVSEMVDVRTGEIVKGNADLQGSFKELSRTINTECQDAAQSIQGMTLPSITNLLELKRAAQETAQVFGTQFAVSILNSMAIVKGSFAGFPTDVMDTLQKAEQVLVANDPVKKYLATQAGAIVGQIKELTNEIADATAHPEKYPQGAVDIFTAQLQAQKDALQDFYNRNRDTFDPTGAAQRQKQMEALQRAKQEEDSLAASAKRVADEQKRLTEITDHWNAQLSIAREGVSQLSSSMASAADMWSQITDRAKELSNQGGLFTNFTQGTAPAQVATWRAQQLAQIENWRQAQSSIVAASGLSPEEAQARFAAINGMASRASSAIVEAANKAHDALARMPQGLTQAQSEFENTITFYQNKINELQAAIERSNQEVTRRQRVVMDTMSGAGARSGLAGPFQPAAEQLASSRPSFLDNVPGSLEKVMGGASATAQQISYLRHLIEDPVTGAGFLAPFMQHVNDAKAALRDLQAAAEETRRMFAARNFELGTQQLDLQLRQRYANRADQDAQFAMAQQQWELQQRQNAEMRPLQEAQYQLSQQMWVERQRENAQMRPLNEALYQYNLALQAERDRAEEISHSYQMKLLPLQRELNELNREANRIAHEEELQNMQLSMENQRQTLAKLTPGTAQYLAVRQQLARAQADYAIKAKQYNLQDEIAGIQAEQEAATTAENERLRAMEKVAAALQRERDAAQHTYDLERQGLQDQSDQLQHRAEVAQHGFDAERQNLDDQNALLEHNAQVRNHNFELESRQIEDRQTLYQEEERQFEYYEGLKEAAQNRVIELASLELAAQQKAGQAWVDWQQASSQSMQDQLTDWQLHLNEIDVEYQTWKTTKLDPLQKQINDELKSAGQAIHDGYQQAINEISQPGGIIDQLTITGTQAESAQKKQVDMWQKSDAALKEYWKDLDRTAQWMAIVAAGGIPGPLTGAPPGQTPAPNNPSNSPNAEGKAEGGWVGLSGPQMVLTGERGPEYIMSQQSLGDLTRLLDDLHPGASGMIGQVGGGGGGGGAAGNNLQDALNSVLSKISNNIQPNAPISVAAPTTISIGAMHFTLQGNYRSQMDANRDIQMILRGISSYDSVTGTSQGYGARPGGARRPV